MTEVVIRVPEWLSNTFAILFFLWVGCESIGIALRCLKRLYLRELRIARARRVVSEQVKP